MPHFGGRFMTWSRQAKRDGLKPGLEMRLKNKKIEVIRGRIRTNGAPNFYQPAVRLRIRRRARCSGQMTADVRMKGEMQRLCTFTAIALLLGTACSPIKLTTREAFVEQLSKICADREAHGIKRLYHLDGVSKSDFQRHELGSWRDRFERDGEFERIEYLDQGEIDGNSIAMLRSDLPFEGSLYKRNLTVAGAVRIDFRNPPHASYSVWEPVGVGPDGSFRLVAMRPE